MFKILPRSTRLLHWLSLALSLFVLVSLPACKTAQTGSSSKKQNDLIVQSAKYVKKEVIDRTLKILFGDSAKFDKDHVEFARDFSLEFIKSKVITNEEIRDFLSPRGGIIAYTENFEGWVKYERTPENKVRVSVHYKELQPKPDSLNRQGLHYHFEPFYFSDMKKILYLNAGHVGMHPQTGAYMTNPAHGKFYHFTDATGKVIHSAYEGKTNRLFAKVFQEIMQGTGVEVVKVYHDFLDTHHMERVAMVNRHFARQPKGTRALYLSGHSNAVGMQSRGKSQDANGWSIWTTDGVTPSDRVADLITTEVKKIAPDFGFRVLESRQDGDSDFEANFDELYFTTPPAVLIEGLFFTNLPEAKLLENLAYQKAHAEAVQAGVLQWFS